MGPVSETALAQGLTDLRTLAEHVRQLPYARPAHPDAHAAVLDEGLGTCSGKHQLLARAARECGFDHVALVVGLYLMGPSNTPGVGPVLGAAGVSALPEAHCYLVVDGERFDFTGLSAGASSPFESLLSEHVVAPDALVTTKRRLHQEAIAAWAARSGMAFTDAWALREACIAALAE